MYAFLALVGTAFVCCTFYLMGYRDGTYLLDYWKDALAKSMKMNRESNDFLRAMTDGLEVEDDQ